MMCREMFSPTPRSHRARPADRTTRRRVFLPGVDLAPELRDLEYPLLTGPGLEDGSAIKDHEHVASGDDDHVDRDHRCCGDEPSDDAFAIPAQDACSTHNGDEAHCDDGPRAKRSNPGGCIRSATDRRRLFEKGAVAKSQGTSTYLGQLLSFASRRHQPPVSFAEWNRIFGFSLFMHTPTTRRQRAQERLRNTALRGCGVYSCAARAAKPVTS